MPFTIISYDDLRRKMKVNMPGFTQKFADVTIFIPSLTVIYLYINASHKLSFIFYQPNKI